jgi:hypothetical protein
MTRRRTGARTSWPAWKLRMLLPEGWRRWDVLRVVRVPLSSPACDAWQVQNKLGQPAGVGLFADRAMAVEWASKRCERLEVGQSAVLAEVEL